MRKKELREQYDIKKEEYVQIKKKLTLPEYVDDKNLHNKNKKLPLNNIPNEKNENINDININ